ncbi:MAG: NlpC/P60 family protein [Ilumatobacteraceae bacterium]
MTIRHRISAVALSSALAVGGFAVVPALVSPVAAQAPVIREDLLGVVAAGALRDLGVYLDTGSPTAQQSYNSARHEIALVVAERLALDPLQLESAWTIADAEHQTALMAALSQLGVAYRHNTSKPGVGFDCSGLTTFAWGRAGITLDRQSGSQIRAAASRSAATAEAGDLVYYPGHVMIWLGVGTAIVHAPFTGRTVEVGFAASGRRHSLRYGDPTA